jgi:hypothetical protein
VRYTKFTIPGHFVVPTTRRLACSASNSPLSDRKRGGVDDFQGATSPPLTEKQIIGVTARLTPAPFRSNDGATEQRHRQRDKIL